MTYTTFQARDLGGDTAELFKTAARDAYERFQPKAMLVGSSCTAELIQDDPGGLSQALGLPIPVMKLELPSYSKKENWGAAETFYQIVRQLADPNAKARARAKAAAPAAICWGRRRWAFAIATTSWKSRRLLDLMGIDVALVAPMGASPARHRPHRSCGFQHCAVSRNRRDRRQTGWRKLSASLACAPCRSAMARHAILSTKSRGSQASMLRQPSPPIRRGCPGIRAQLTRPT